MKHTSKTTSSMTLVQMTPDCAAELMEKNKNNRIIRNENVQILINRMGKQ